MPTTYRKFKTKLGRQVWLRQVSAADAHYLVDMFEHLSPQSRYMRFHEPLEAPDPALVLATAQEMARNIPLEGRGWLAFVRMGRHPQVAVGGVRWVRVEPGVAEIALTVRDDYQGQGIGREMLLTAVLDARSDGIKKIIAMFHGANQSVTQLLRHAPAPVVRSIHAGEIYIEADLTHSGWESALLPYAA